MYSKNVYVVYLKFTLNWPSCVFYVLSVAAPYRMALQIADGSVSATCVLTPLPWTEAQAGKRKVTQCWSVALNPLGH